MIDPDVKRQLDNLEQGRTTAASSFALATGAATTTTVTKIGVSSNSVIVTQPYSALASSADIVRTGQGPVCGDAYSVGQCSHPSLCLSHWIGDVKSWPLEQLFSDRGAPPSLGLKMLAAIGCGPTFAPFRRAASPYSEL
jgi:hypothetical protein